MKPAAKHCGTGTAPAFVKKPLVGLISLVLAMALTVPAFAAKPRVYRAGDALETKDLPERSHLRKHLDGLRTDAAKTRAVQWLRSFTFTDQDLEHLRGDAAGGIFYADNFAPPEAATTVTGSTVQTSAITATEAFALHSRPGSANVVYLDFTGHVVTGTAWNSTYPTLNAVPFDQDGDATTFSAAELASIAQIWRRIAEDYAPFGIDVTTQEPASFGPRTARVLITRDSDAAGLAMPAQGAGGVAYVNVFGMSSFATTYSPAFVYFNRLASEADYIAEAASHELGHNLGLSHDGTSTQSYFGGMGSGYISWGPIMGTGYYRNVSQWSRGEYTDANNTQDDLALIAGKLAYRVDDHANSSVGATPLALDAAGNFTATTPETDPANSNTANKGVIGATGDIDFFTFTTAGGAVVLNALPARESSYTRGGDLDIRLSLYDANGSLMARDDPQTDTHASLALTLNPGTYFLALEGVGNAITPYSNYGSLGQYFLSGNVPVSGIDTMPNPFSFAALTNVDLSTYVESAVVTIAGINAPAAVAVSGGEFRVNGGSYGSAGSSVNSGDTVQVRHLSAAAGQTRVTTTLNVGGVAAAFSSTTATADTMPSAFSFTALTGVPLATLVESNVISVAGINAPAAVSVTGGQYRINGGVYGSVAGVVRKGDSVQVRHTSSASSGGSVTTTLKIGGVSGSFKSTTVVADTRPDVFAFTALTGVPRSTLVESNAVTVTGINAPAAISVSGGQYSVNGGAYVSIAGKVSAGATVKVRHTSSSRANTTVTTTLTIGGVKGTFKSTTAR